MIRFLDAVVLAVAKLHSRRILLAITVLTSGLLFGSLYGGTFLLSGIESSMKSFTEEAHNGKYLVKANPVIPQAVYLNNGNLSTETIKELRSLEAEYISKAKQSAKELDVSFDEELIKSPLKPSPFIDPALPADEQLMIDFESPIYSEYLGILEKEYAENAKNTKDNLKTIASKYDYRDVYTTITAKTSYTDSVYLQDGKEDLGYLTKTPEFYSSGPTPYGYAVNSVRNSGYQMLDSALLQNWILPTNEKRQANLDAIPVIISTREAVSLFGKDLNILNEPPLAAEKINWMKDLQAKINGQTYTACYRNAAERLQLTQAIRDLSDIKANEKNKSYTVPKIIYDLPTQPCEAMTVKKDDRTLIEKREELNRIESEKRLNIYDEPQRKLLEFQIVGVVDLSESSFGATNSVDDLANDLFANNLQTGALIPQGIYEKSNAKKLYDEVLFGERSKGVNSEDIYTKYGLLESTVTFSDLASARKFIKNEGCSETTPDCNKLFRLDPFGSNYLLLDDLQSAARKALSIMLPIFIGIAGIVTFFTMSRIIIDSRRETAVFRALGAKRIDIVALYATYGLIVSIITLVVSVLIGLVIALVVQTMYGDSFTTQARVAYGLFDSSLYFSFFGANYALLILYGISILVIGFAAIILPLFRNIRRNPIADMREE